MKIKLEKWYLDFTSKKALGFYYIMCLTMGPFRFGFSGINHFQSGELLKSFRFSRELDRSYHGLRLGNASFTTSLQKASLHIDHKRSQLLGSWRFLAPPQKRLRKPFFNSIAGWSDWKVWTPKAAVAIKIVNRGETTCLKGTGYIDYVRCSLASWNIPFRRLYWGRLHSKDSWAVFIKLNSKNQSLSMYMDPYSVEQKISARLQRDQLQKPVNFIWTIDSQHKPGLFDCRIERELEDEEILSKGRLLKLFPSLIRKKLGSSGHDQKFEVTSEYEGEEYKGIMEEVIWNE